MQLPDSPATLHSDGADDCDEGGDEDDGPFGPPGKMDRAPKASKAAAAPDTSTYCLATIEVSAACLHQILL